MECNSEMTDTISISPKPKIKCYAGNNKLCNMLFYGNTKTTLEKIKKLLDEGRLWTGESVYCICTHHVVQHCTVRDHNGSVIIIHCHGNEESCNCELFRTRSVRLSHSYYRKTGTEGLDIV